MQNLFVASFDFMEQSSFQGGVSTFIADRSPIWSWMAEHWDAFAEWVSQPDVLHIIMAWWITFTLAVTILMTLGFGPSGIIAGSVAAGFQSWMYGGFTPAAGIFATLTSVGMLGLALPVFTTAAMLLATVVAAITWVGLQNS